jgi:hypothetical protein
MSTGTIDWIGMITGAVFIAIGLAYLFSRRFVAFALKYTSAKASQVRQTWRDD